MSSRLKLLQEMASTVDVPEFCISEVKPYIDGLQFMIRYNRDGKKYFVCVHIDNARQDLRNVQVEFDGAAEIMRDAIDRGLPCD